MGPALTCPETGERVPFHIKTTTRSHRHGIISSRLCVNTAAAGTILSTRKSTWTMSSPASKTTLPW